MSIQECFVQRTINLIVYKNNSNGYLFSIDAAIGLKAYILFVLSRLLLHDFLSRYWIIIEE